MRRFIVLPLYLELLHWCVEEAATIARELEES